MPSTVVFPVRNGMNRRVFLRPSLACRLQLPGQILPGDANLRTMLTRQSRFDNVSRKQRKKRSATARGLPIRGWGRHDSFVPDLAVVPNLSRQPVGPDQRMRQTPNVTLNLSESLRQPSTQRQIIEITKDAAVVFPQPIRRGFGIFGHRPQGARGGAFCRGTKHSVPARESAQLWNVNSPEDWREARRRWAQRGKRASKSPTAPQRLRRRK